MNNDTLESMARWHDRHALAFPEGSEYRKFHEESAAEIRATKKPAIRADTCPYNGCGNYCECYG